MARTPLFRTLARVLHLTRGAARAGVPVAEHAAAERERRAISRRRLLGLATAAAVLPALPGCFADDTAPLVPPTVAIVGAGIAGLHCAYRLKKLGLDATVYDANTRVGGRMFTDRTTFPEGMHCELGGEFIDTDHHTMHDLATELGLDLYDYDDDDPDLIPYLVYMDGAELTADAVFTAFVPIAKQVDDALKTLKDPTLRLVTHDNPNGGEALDAMSLGGWLDSVGVTGPIRRLLELVYILEFGLEPDVSSALNLLLTIDTDATKLALGGDSDERFHTKLGNDSFPTRLAAALDPAQIELGAALVALAATADGRYRLTLEQGGATKEVTADHVVLALPFSTLRSVAVTLDLPAVKQAAIAEMGYGTNAKLITGFSSRLWRSAYHSNGDTLTDFTYQSTWETSRLQPGASGIITNFTGGKHGVALGAGTPDERLAEMLADLEKVYPGVSATSNGKVARMAWPSFPLTLGSYSGYLVGQYTKFAGAEIERFQNVHFCGEHTSLEAQGFMEGGALTGAMAAAEIAADLGLAVPALAKHRAPRSFLDPGDRILARARATWERRRRHQGRFRHGVWRG
jgi:monoamine oxidase